MDIKLSNDKEITFNMNAFKLAEYIGMFEDDENETSEEKQNKVVSKATGMSAEDIAGLGFEDNRRLFAKFYSKAREVTKDPNSASAST